MLEIIFIEVGIHSDDNQHMQGGKAREKLILNLLSERFKIVAPDEERSRAKRENITTKDIRHEIDSSKNFCRNTEGTTQLS